MRSNLPRRPVEFYGESVTTAVTPELQASINAEHCPFINSRCVKQRKSSASQTIGTCVVGYQDASLIICPKRFLQGHQIFLDSIRFLPRNGRYFSVPEITTPGGHVDYFLVLQDEIGQIQDYVGIEIQALDTTGTGGLWDARVDALSGNLRRDYSYGINWKMSAKTILMQMHHKATTFETLGKKLVLVIQSEFLTYMEREFQSTHLRTADPTDSVQFHAYDCIQLGNQTSIVLRTTKSTSAAGIERMLGVGNTIAATDDSIKLSLVKKWHKAFEVRPAR